jgi:phage terminase large subunit
LLATIAKAFPGQRILVAADTMPNLKDGAISAFEKYVQPDFSHDIRFYNQTDKVIFFNNKSIIKFKSFEKEEGARGAEWDYVFFNEANLFKYDIFWQVQRKTRCQFILDYNPTSRFWAHDKLVDGKEKQFTGKVVFFRVWHEHNPFLSQELHDSYENISDPDLYKVYARGETGAIRGVIYNFKTCDKIPDDCTSIIWGHDYGYTNDPTAIVKIGVRGKDRFIQECCYVPLDDSKAIKDIMVKNGWNPAQHVYVEHDVRIQMELLNLGMPLFLANKKNKVSNISKVKSFNIFITEDSKNAIDEFTAYKWVSAVNIKTGDEVQINKPIDGNDHICDAVQYAINTHALMYNL